VQPVPCVELVSILACVKRRNRAFHHQYIHDLVAREVAALDQRRARAHTHERAPGAFHLHGGPHVGPAP